LAGQTITLGAVVRDATGDEIPVQPGESFVWEDADPALSLVGTSARTADFQVQDPVADPVAVDVKAAYEWNGGSYVSAPARVTLFPRSTAVTGDRIQRTSDGVISVALLDGVPAVPSDCNDRIVAVDDVATFPNLESPCPNEGRGEVILFSPDKQLVFEERIWDPLPELVNETGIGGPLALPVRVAVAAVKPRASVDPIVVAKNDMTLANAYYADNRSAISFAYVEGEPKQVSPDLLGYVPLSCAALDELDWASPDAPRPPLYVPGVVNVYYVDHLDNGYRGEACPPLGDRSEPFIFVSTAKSNQTTLAHEFGHLLGLNSRLAANHGHSHDFYGFPNTNLMRGGVDDTEASGRSTLTFGQSFRMNVDPLSWLNEATQYPNNDPPQLIRQGDTSVCQCEWYRNALSPGWPSWEDPAVDKACPALIFAPGQSWTGPLLPNRLCTDWVNVPLVEKSSEHAVVVNARFGREGLCESMVGELAKNPGYPTYMFPNIGAVRIGCPTWIAVFLGDHAPMHRQLILGSTPPGPELGIGPISVSNAPHPKLDVDVHYRTEDDDQPFREAVNREHQTAIAIWEQDHLTGLSIDATWGWADGFTGTSIKDLTPVTKGAINVYYLPADGSHLLEGDAAADGGIVGIGDDGEVRIVMPGAPGARVETSLAHHIGHLLGLDHVSAGDGLGAANVMWDDLAGGRTELTLGQIFRVYMSVSSWFRGKAYDLSFLGPAKDCQAEPLDCPPVALDDSP
ncbi:MAG: hypothetical protein R3195_10160, partial [Gemmatimonadota bacterium]|nr:hypothetical protein [Gemmatimonadota bacterium]